jgi:Tfp pilus assembly protein PilX
MEAVIMQSARKISKWFVANACRSEQGVILIAVLTLMVTLILVGATTYIVSSSNIKISANFKSSETVLQVAMAGSEKAREALRAANAASTVTTDFSQELAARVGANGVLNGYSTTTDDVPMATGTMNVGGNTYTYNAYLTNDSTDISTPTTDSNGRVVITSVATGPNSAKASVTTTVQIYTFSGSSPAALYSKDNTTLNGSSINISGTDAGNCGGSNLSAVYVYSDPATNNTHTLTENGSPTLGGTPATQLGTTSLDLQSYIDTLKGSATVTLTADVSAGGNATTSYGSSTNYATVYSDATQQGDGELRLNNVTGYGILLVKGNLQLAGNVNWHGIIIATGVVTTSGGGGNAKNIQGQVYSGQSALGDTTVNGGVTISYNSCEVKKSLSSQPLTVVNWKQN